MNIKPIGLINYTYINRDENKKAQMPATNFISTPQTMPDGFERRNFYTVTFGGFFDFFKKKNVDNLDEDVPESLGQKSNEIEEKDYTVSDKEFNQFAKKLYKLTRKEQNDFNCPETMEYTLKLVVQMLESPQFVPANFSTKEKQGATKLTLEEIIAAAADKYKPYILLETFGDTDNKIHKPLRLDCCSPQSVIDVCLKNPDKYMDKTLDYLKYQEGCTDNDELAAYLTGRYANYDQAKEFIALLANNNKITGAEEIYEYLSPQLHNKIPLAVWYAMRSGNITQTPFSPAKIWYLSSQTDYFDSITESIKTDIPPEQLLKTVDELFTDYTIDSSHTQLLHKALEIIFSNIDNPKLGKDWENLLLEKVITQPDKKKGITEAEAKKINLDIINTYQESSKNPSPELLSKMLRKANIPLDDNNLSTAEQVAISLERLGNENTLNSRDPKDTDALMTLFKNHTFGDILLQRAEESDESYKQVINLYKLYFNAGGKADFTRMSYQRAKLYKEAGLTPVSVDIHGNNFYGATKNFKDENGDVLFPIESLPPEIIKREFGDPNSYYGTKNLSEYLKEFKTPDKMLDEYSGILEIQKQYSSSPQYYEDMLYRNLRYSAHGKFTESYTCSDFVKYLDKLKSQSSEYSDSELSEYLSTMMDNSSDYHEYKDTLLIKLAFDLLGYDEQKKALEIMAPYGVAQLPLKLFSANTAAKLGLDLYLADYPELKDGICSMEDFYTRIHIGESSKHMLVPYVYNVEVNDDKETLIDILIGINCNDKLDKMYKQRILNNLEDYKNSISWKHCDKFGNNYMMKAILAEDYQTIKFLKDKNIDITQRNQFGQNTIDLIEQSSPKIKKLFEGVKAQSKELIDLVEMGNVSGAELLLKNKYIDINSLKDSWSKYTPLHLAACNDDVDMAEMLIKYPEIDFNAQTGANETFATIIADHKNVRMVTDVLAKIPPEKIDLNGIYNSSSGAFSVYGKAVTLNRYNKTPERIENQAKFFEELLKLKGADPNISSENLPPVAFTLVDAQNLELFKILANSGKLDIHKTYNGKNLQEYINDKRWLCYSERDRKDFLEALSKAVDLSAISSFKQKIEVNGVLTLDDISQFLKYPNLNGIISQNLSDSNEKISHLLCDIEMTPQNTVQILNLARKMISADKKAFTYRDIFGQSAADKVLLAENEVLLEYILKNSTLSDKDIDKLSEQAKLLNNPKINKLITQRIMTGGPDDNK